MEFLAQTLTRASPEEGTVLTGALLLWGKAERAGLVQSGEETTLGSPYGILPVSEGSL